MSDEFYMQLALDEAWKYQLLTYPNPSVGAVVVQNGAILSIEAHQKAGTSHAEVLALLSAYERLSQTTIDFDRFNATKAHNFLRQLPDGFFGQCSIYVTLEPCSHRGKTPSCALLLKSLHLKEIVVGIEDPIEGHSGGIGILDSEDNTPMVRSGILIEACHALIEPFLIWQEKAFVLFKLAQTINGRIGGGYLSSEDSLRHVHRLRAVCNKLFIGGNTVRVDRPTLDCRFVDAPPPDVMIYSKSGDFDQNIPLFGIEGRDVNIAERLDFLEIPSFIMVEGGEGMLRALKKHIDWLLFYHAPKLSTNELSYNIDMNLAFLHQQSIGVDVMIWSRQLGN